MTIELTGERKTLEAGWLEALRASFAGAEVTNPAGDLREVTVRAKVGSRIWAYVWVLSRIQGEGLFRHCLRDQLRDLKEARETPPN